jgi:hypothetical protein
MGNQIDEPNFDNAQEITQPEPSATEPVKPAPADKPIEQYLKDMAQDSIKFMENNRLKLEQINQQIGEKLASNNKEFQLSKAALQTERAAYFEKSKRLIDAETEFFQKVKVEMPEIMRANMKEVAKGLLEVELKDITTKHVNPMIAAANKAADNFRKEAREFYGWEHLLVQIGIGAAAALVVFGVMKFSFGIGEDAKYGRSARTFIQSLDAKNKTAIEMGINRINNK